jgi:hypothetical protein
MARIDVSELMNDPDFVNNFTVVRRVPTINTYGENTLAETQVAAVGSIQSPGKEVANRLPDGVKLSSVKTIYTKTVLNADKASGYVDQIIWEGLRYNVVTVLPWGNFGSGWYECDVELEKASL